jgi:PucR C-terminal helix-turn-helix domain
VTGHNCVHGHTVRHGDRIASRQMRELGVGEIGVEAPLDGLRGEPAAERFGWRDRAANGRSRRARGLATLAGILARTDLDAVARRMVERYVDEIPSYARLAPELLWGRKLDQARAHLALFLDVTKAGGEIADGDLALARSSARVDLRDGISLDDLLQAYRIGGVVAWREIAGGARTEDHVAAAAAGELYVRFAENVSSAAAKAYRDELERIGLRDDPLHRALFEGLVGATMSERELGELADELRFALRPSYRPFVASWSERPQRELARMLCERGVFALVDGGRVAGFASDDRAGDLLRGAGATFALGSSTERAALAAALTDLHLLVDVARRAGRRGRIGEHEFLVERCVLAAPALGATLERVVLRPIEEHDAAHGSELLATLEAFVAAGLSRKTAAKRLTVHPNTLDYRLDRIKQLTSLTLTAPRDLALVTLALAQRGLSRGGPVARHSPER